MPPNSILSIKPILIHVEYGKPRIAVIGPCVVGMAHKEFRRHGHEVTCVFQLNDDVKMIFQLIKMVDVGRKIGAAAGELGRSAS